MDVCELCKNERKLCRSHIYPEFLYKATYDEKGRALFVDPRGSGKLPFIQKGLRQELLCQDCESDFSKFERYFKQLWFDEERIPTNLNEEYLLLSGFEYETVKLFFLSVIWRASVSSESPFGEVNLGAHEERIRQILDCRLVPPPNKYQLMGRILVSRKENRVIREFVVTPRRVRLGRHWAYEMVFGSVSWIFLISNESRQDLADLCLADPGRILLTRLFVDQYDAARDLVRSGRLDDA